MGREKKAKLDYFPLDTAFFEDKKIKGLRGKFGNSAVVLYIFILCEIYGDKGYYTVFDDDFLDMVTDEIRESEEFVRQVISHLCKRSMLDSTLLTSVNVLTSSAVQRQYQTIKSKNGQAENTVEVDGRIWLLSENETLNCIKVTHMKNKSAENADKSAINADKSAENQQSKVKESKVNKNKVNSVTPDKPAKHKYGKYKNVLLSDEEVEKLKSKLPNFEKNLETFSQRLEMKNYKYKSHYLAMLNWFKDEQQQKTTSYELNNIKAKVNNFD